jgi:hypothetical protein
MVAHGGESPTRKAIARRHVAHATVGANKKYNIEMDKNKLVKDNLVG